MAEEIIGTVSDFFWQLINGIIISILQGDMP